jgi:CBS domain containing-hemolysin-like protein
MDRSDAIRIALELLAVVALVLLNAFFVASEFAIVKIRTTQLDALARKGDRRAKIARRVVGNLNSYLSACQLGITLASLGLGWIGEPVASAILAPVMSWLDIESEQLRQSIAFVVGFSAITFLHIAAGEQAPKSLAIQVPTATALAVSRPLVWFHRVSFPFIWVLNHSSLLMLRAIGLKPKDEAEHVHSEEELRLILAAASRQSGGSRLGREIVLNAFDLGHRSTRDVMRPRQEIVCLSTTATMDECLELAEKMRYSRYPLVEDGDPDRTLGIVHYKDLFAMRQKARSGADLTSVMKPIIYTPETARLEALLSQFLERKLHFAIVVDEYGGTAGAVTLENVLEELVGQIQDEFDSEKPLLEQKADGAWVLSGLLPLYELSEIIGEPLHEEGITTVSGLVTQRLGGFPKAGDELSLGGYRIRVEATEGLRVARLCLTRLGDSAAPERCEDLPDGEEGES